MTDWPAPPANISLLVELLGVHGTLALIEKRGGTQFWVPAKRNNSSHKLQAELTAELGATALAALIETFGGESISVPLCGEWRTAVYAAMGLNHTEIARRLGCHVNTVGRRLKRRTVENRQSAWSF